jgi:hypothetical protein
MGTLIVWHGNLHCTNSFNLRRTHARAVNVLPFLQTSSPSTAWFYQHLDSKQHMHNPQSAQAPDHVPHSPLIQPAWDPGHTTDALAQPHISRPTSPLSTLHINCSVSRLTPAYRQVASRNRLEMDALRAELATLRHSVRLHSPRHSPPPNSSPGTCYWESCEAFRNVEYPEALSSRHAPLQLGREVSANEHLSVRSAALHSLQVPWKGTADDSLNGRSSGKLTPQLQQSMSTLEAQLIRVIERQDEMVRSVHALQVRACTLMCPVAGASIACNLCYDFLDSVGL